MPYTLHTPPMHPSYTPLQLLITPLPPPQVGYDSSPYAVAKTAVIVEMMRGGASTDAVVQVWYSCAWSRATLAAFRAALTSLLTGGQGGAGGQPAEVVDIWRHWQVGRGVLGDSHAHCHTATLSHCHESVCIHPLKAPTTAMPHMLLMPKRV